MGSWRRSRPRPRPHSSSVSPPALANVGPRSRTSRLPTAASYAYIEATSGDGEHLRLFRLRHVGYASQWGFAIYRASHHDYHQAFLPGGWHAGAPEDALDTACGL